MKITLQLFLFLLIFSSLNLRCQTYNDSLLSTWQNDKLENTIRAEAYSIYLSQTLSETTIDSAYSAINKLLLFTEKYNLLDQYASALSIKGETNKKEGDYESAIINFKNSLKIYRKINDKKGESKALINLGVMFRDSWKFDEASDYFNKSLSISKELSDTIMIARSLQRIGSIFLYRFKTEKALNYYEEALDLIKLKKSPSLKAVLYGNIGACLTIKKEFNTSITYLNKSIKIGEELNNKDILTDAYKLLSQNYLKQKKYNKLIESARLSLKYAELTKNKVKIENASYFLFEGYRGKKDFDSTFFYYDKGKKFRTEASDLAAEKTLQKIQIKTTKAKDSLMNLAKNLKTEMLYQNEKNNLKLIWVTSFVILLIIGFLIFRKIKRKQYLAEKERQQQIEEKEKILKDLELSTIDAMIKGQEKERQRLAEDLHDSVGATLAAAKLQFNHLIKNQNDTQYSEDLIKKTSTLLEDAYVEIRSMAHLKNSGVIAKNGLLPAVEKLSKNASSINGPQFEVQSFGLEQRLENSLEISIFRIIQELITNVIKHAEASEANINLTNHEDIINIMVEDNGKGFNPNQITKTNTGMGISSIDRRVKHLDGILTIESEKDKGTTVIIDIPL